MPRRGLDSGRVIAEAGALADEEGLDAVTLAGVAARLGVRAPSLYKHVAGLDALRAGLAARAVSELTDVLGAAVAGRAGRDALQAGGTAYVTWARAHPGRYALTIRAPHADDAPHRAAAARGVDTIRAILRQLDLHDEDAVHAVRAIRSALHGFCTIEATGGFGLTLDPDVSLHRLLDVLWTGLASPPR